MAKILCLRIASALGLLLLAFFLVGIDPFLPAAQQAGASYTAPTTSVNRLLKSDRLPIQDLAAVHAPDWNYEFGAFSQSAPDRRAEIPVGCDAAFSQIFSSARKQNVYRRCTV